MRRIIIGRFLPLALALAFASSTFAAGFKIIVNSSVHVSALPKKTLSDLFMKKMPRWDNGTPVVAVDQTDAAGVREDFSRAVHGKQTAAVKSYWNQQIFSGREVPPVEKSGDAAVVAFVRATPGAVGYVSAATPADGVRVVEVQ